MTLPNGIAGISEAIGNLFAITGDPATYIPGGSWGVSSISQLPALTQTFVTDLLKANVVQVSTAWNQATADVWAGLRRGDPLGGAVSLPLAIIEQMVSQLLGLPPGTWTTVEDALAAIEGLPGIAQLIQLLTGLPGVISSYDGVLTTWATNLRAFFTGIDLNDPALNITTALTSWVAANVLPYLAIAIGDVSGLADALAALAPIDNIVNALGVSGTGHTLADLTNVLTHIPGANLVSVAAGIITGVLSGTNIPGLDFTKIVSGQLDPLRATWVAPIDNIVNALGNAGTGKTVTDLVYALGHIPGANLISVAASIVTGILPSTAIPGLDFTKITTGQLDPLRATWVAPIDNIVNALGVAGSGFSVTDLANALTHIPGANLVSVAATIVTGILPATAIPGIDASKLISGQVAQARATWAAPIDTLIQAWGGIGSGFLPADLTTFASAIPHDNLTGTLGGNTIGTTIQNLLDAGVKAVQNNPALSGQSIAQWNNTVAALMGFIGYNPAGATQSNSVADITSKNNQNLNNRAVQKNPFENIDPTIDATFPFNDVATLATLPTIAVTATTPVSAPIRIRDGGIKQSIRFKGYVSSGSLTGFYVNLYHVDPTTGAWTWFYSSTDYHASLATGATPQWNSLNLAAAAYVNAAQGDMIQAEITVTGGGTYTMVGKTLSNQLLPMPGAIPSLPAAQRYPTNTPTIVATGTGAFNGGPGTRNLTITVPANATCLFVPFQFYNTGSGGFTSSVAIGATNFNSINADQYRNNASQYAITLHGFYLMNPPTGPQTITFTFSGTGSLVMCGNPLAISNVSSVGSTVILGPASGTAIAQSINPADTNALYINLMGEEGGAGSTITYNSGGGTSLYSTPGISGSAYPFLVGSKSGVSPAAFAATASTSAAYGSIIVPFVGSYQPAPTTVANPSAPGTAGVTSYNRLQPWIGLAGSAGATAYSPVTDPYATPGSGISIQNPAVKYPWANNFDIVMCSDGSGGEGGGYPVGGVGGKAGTWTRQTLTRAQIGTSNLTLNIGAGSAGTGPGVGGSSAAGGVSVVVPGFGTVSQTGAPGSGSGLSPSAYGVAGDSPGNFSYTDANGVTVPFTGGAGGSGGQAPGGQPGAGGSGGNATYMPNFNGGPGGAAEVWIRSYQ